MTEFTEFPIPTQVVDIQETPKAAALPRARASAPHIARGWIDPVAAVPPGTVLTIPDYLPIPEGWWSWAAAADGFRQICNWTPEALRTGNTDVRDLTIDPKRLFTDTDGLIPVAAPGALVAAHRDSQGRKEATQVTSAARPVYGRHPPRGRVNRLPNNGTEGAVPGVIGSGGALPTGWTLSFPGGAAGTVDVLAITDEYIDIEIDQTESTGAPLINFNLGLSAQSPSVQGDNWYFGVSAALIGGSLGGNGTPQLRGSQRDGSGNALTSLSFLDPANLTGTLTRFGGTDQVDNASAAFVTVDFRVQSTGPWTATFRISRPQLERGTEATALQNVRAGGFDVTEPGERDICYIGLDAVDDWLALAAAFEPSGAYTLAAVRGFDSLSALNNDPGVSFGWDLSSVAYLTRQSSATMHLRVDTSANYLTSSGGFGDAANNALRTVEIARVADAATGNLWRNGVAASAVIVEGTLTPLRGLNTIGNRGGGFGAGRFYGGVLIDRAITEPERQMLDLYLASKGGIAL